jgi:hypothetical protein
MNRAFILLLSWSLNSPLVAVAATKNCPAQCETQRDTCLKEAQTEKVRETCKAYFKGCLKSCSQAK